MSSRRAITSIVLVPAAIALGCGPEELLNEEVTTSTREPLRGPRFEMPQNGLHPDAARVNVELLSALKATTLSDAGLSALLNQQSLADLFYTGAATSAENLMAEVVSCALDATQAVTPDGYASTWRGRFGLCPGWSDTQPTQDCLDLVSACVLARMNALDREVPISIHVPGDHEPSPRVKLHSFLRDRTRIRSLDRCPISVMYVADTCNWQPHFVGICKQGTPVTLQRNAWMSVRVCNGIHACDVDQEDQSFPDSPPYAGFVDQFTAGDTPITFTCPDDEGAHPRGQPHHRYFSIMVGKVPYGWVEDDDIVGSGLDVTYPADESQVFTYPEGSFYGDIFTGSSDDLGYVCHSDLWRTGGTYLTDRLCANPSDRASCGAIGGRAACRDVCGAGLSAPPEEAYRDCEGGGRVWNGVTVYLNDHRDLSRDPASSAIVCTPHDECTPGAPLPDGCSPVVTSVCAADPYCCSTEWDGLCVSEVLSAANSLMCPVPSCGHALCTEGDALTPGCDVPPLTSSGCVKLLCDQDPYCCGTAWDTTCVSEVQSVCGKTCN
ncbi:hypothetical protein [Sorangium sp. So ce1153]|uniref:hypothetical protein n=1 Tax=Sorangium sp. So ce1153 TaxID=3133333 RepID=UPI003F60AB61